MADRLHFSSAQGIVKQKYCWYSLAVPDAASVLPRCGKDKSMETVLLYNIAGTPLAAGLKPVLLKMKLRVRVVTPDQYFLSIGELAGLQRSDSVSGPGSTVPAPEAPDTCESFREPMMVMSGFTDQRLNQFLFELRKRKLPPIHLKAVLTEHNRHWNSLTLFHELKAEHQAMHKISSNPEN